MHPQPDLALKALGWGTALLSALLLGLLLAGAWIQIRRDRQNQHRIARFQVWEKDLAAYLFGGNRAFPDIAPEDQRLFQTFLSRYHATLGGQEGEALRELFLQHCLHEDLSIRLRHRWPAVRAQAAQLVSVFRLVEHFEGLVPLLRDPVPFVAHAAAQALARAGGLRFASAVLAWALRETHYQRERLLRVLEGFGPEFLDWLDENLESPELNPKPWILFALLAASHRHQGSGPRLLELLNHPVVDLQASALKALATLADPLAFPQILPLARHEAWPVRAQASKALGLIGGPAAIPTLLSLTADTVYEVRRNAAQALADLGHAGTSALARLAGDPSADPFARDIARERLEWAEERGHQ